MPSQALPHKSKHNMLMQSLSSEYESLQIAARGTMHGQTTGLKTQPSTSSTTDLLLVGTDTCNTHQQRDASSNRTRKLENVLAHLSTLAGCVAQSKVESVLRRRIKSPSRKPSHAESAVCDDSIVEVMSAAARDKDSDRGCERAVVGSGLGGGGGAGRRLLSGKRKPASLGRSLGQ